MNGVTIDDIAQAAARIAPAIYPTPLVRLPLPGEVYAKAENLQRTNSFKLRGAYNFLASLPPEVRARGVVAHSSGNHAQGVACAAKLFGVPATIVIPEGASPLKIARTRAWGAEVVRCPDSREGRAQAAERIARERGYTLVPPFDHPWIVAGQGTVGLELARDLPEVANVLVCVGGGGLISGVATALAARCPEAQVVGVEPALAADAAASFAADELLEWPAEQVTRTVADGARTQRVGDLPWQVIRQRVAGFVTVPEAAILEAVRWYATEARLVVEPTGALTLAAYRLLEQGLAAIEGRGEAVALRDGPTVLLISGGNVAPQLLADLLREPPVPG